MTYIALFFKNNSKNMDKSAIFLYSKAFSIVLDDKPLVLRDWKGRFFKNN
jgi:hypothetical protein